MSPSSCPDRERLLKLASGVAVVDSQEIERHLLECAACAEIVAQELERDPLAGVIREAAWPPVSADPDVERIASRLVAEFETQLPTGDATFVAGSVVDDDFDLSWLTSAARPDELGRLGDYRILKLLGRGGMGAVFEAEDTRLKRRVALKVMRPGLSADVAPAERFLREARSAAAIKHRNVVTIYAVGESNDIPYLAMELLEGETLEDRLSRSSKLPVADAVSIARQVAEGLSAAHRQGLLHRDIKPGNIWLDPNGDVKLLDFGLARAIGGGDALTQSGLLVGTLKYLSPEQARGVTLDERSDLFSLGCVLYQMLTGKLPHDGTDAISQLHSLANTQPRRIESLNQDVPADLAELTHRLLSREATQRPATAAEVASALQQMGTHATPAAAAVPPRKANRKWLAAAWAGAAALLLAGVIITVRDKDGNIITRLFVNDDDATVAVENNVDSEDVVPNDLPSPVGSGDVEISTTFAIQTLDHFRAVDIPAIEQPPLQPVELVSVLGAHRLTEWACVYDVAFHPAGSYILPELEYRMSSNIWSTESGGLAYRFPNGEPADGQAVFSPDGMHVFTAGKLYRFEETSPDQLALRGERVLAGAGAPWGAFSPDGRWLITLKPDEGTFRFWDLSQEELSSVFAGVYSSDESHFDRRLTITEQPARLVIDYPRGHRPETHVYDIDWSISDEPRLSDAVHRAERWVYCTSSTRALEIVPDGTVRVHDVSGSEPSLLVELSPQTQSYVPQDVLGDISADGRTVAIHHGTGASLHREIEGEWRMTDVLMTNSSPATIRFSPDGSLLCIAGSDGHLNLWDVSRTPATKLHQSPLASRVTRLTISPDGSYVGVIGDDGSTVYDLTSPVPTRLDEMTSPHGTGTDWAFNVDPPLAFLPGQEVWNLSEQPAIRISRPIASTSGLYVIFDPEHRSLITMRNVESASLLEWYPWEVDSRDSFHLLPLERSWTMSAWITQPENVRLEGETVLGADAPSGSLRVFELEGDSEAVHEFGPDLHTPHCLSPSGNVAASWYMHGPAGKLWDLAAEPVREYSLPQGIVDATFMKDETKLLMVNSQNEVVIYDWRLDREIHRIPMPGRVVQVRMHPDGKHLLTVNGNGTVYILRLPEVASH
ncbi:MAG: WD40 repeat domain-containing serine/threonine protein kinase [Thermomicrobiales bacterium]